PELYTLSLHDALPICAGHWKRAWSGPSLISRGCRVEERMRFLVTGTAGFIGFHLAKRLVGDGHAVIGIDGITPYYDRTLKRARHEELDRSSNFAPHELMLE